MVKPSFTQGSNKMADMARMCQAIETATQMEAGKPVSPKARAQATEVLLELLYTMTGMGANISHALVVLCRSSKDVVEQAELFGEFVAAGERGQLVLDQLTEQTLPEPIRAYFRADELTSLQESLTQPPHERLAVIAEMLDHEQSQTSSPPPTRPEEPTERPEEHAPQPRPPTIESKDEDRDSSGTGPDPEKPISSVGQNSVPQAVETAVALRDSNMLEEARLDAALSVGKSAVPELAGMLQASPNDQEFACAALVHLGRTNEAAARSVLNHMRQLESDPNLRPIAELIRSQVEDDSNQTADLAARHRAKDAKIADGWLRRAIDNCDRPNILKAAAGRDVLAIPLALKRLVAMRASRRGRLE